MKVQLETYMKLIEDYARVALRKIRKPSIYSYEDLIQEGSVAFLHAKKYYSSKKGASFKTFLILLLRHHFSNIVKSSYQGDKKSEFNQEELLNITAKLSIDPVEIVHVSLFLKELTLKELKYIKTMLVLQGEKRSLRRKIVRKMLSISSDEETVIRNSIGSKMTKTKRGHKKMSLLEITQQLISNGHDKDEVIFALITERIGRFGDDFDYAKKRATIYYNYVQNLLKNSKK